MGVTVVRLPKFEILYDLPAGTNTVIAIGGRGGTKTYEVSKFAAFSATMKRKRTVILRDEKELIRESILAEILQRFDTANETGALTPYFGRLETGLRDKKSGDMIVFTQGFRASSNKKGANLKGISNIDIAIIEEAEDIRDETKFNTFVDSLRKEGVLVVILLNTPDIQHWIIKRYFNLQLVEDGYWKLIPKQLPGFVCIQTSYIDNPFLPDHVVQRYESYGDKTSSMYNPHYYKTAILGWASSGRKGQVHKNVKPISLAEYMALPYKEYYGQDFGTAAPAGLVGVKFHKNNCYCRQINYLPMTTLSLGRLYCDLKFTEKDKIIADAADKKAIDKLSGGFSAEELSAADVKRYPGLLKGFYIVGAKKGQDSLEFGINVMDSLNLYAVEESTDLWNEIYNRIYAKDKTENYINEPEPGFDHLLDGWMYVCVDAYGDLYTKDRLSNKMGYFR